MMGQVAISRPHVLGKLLQLSLVPAAEGLLANPLFPSAFVLG